MTIIGTFKQEENGYTGKLHTLTINTTAQLVPNDSKVESAPVFRILAGTVEIGAAWNKRSKNNRQYLAVTLDDPTLPTPIYANLIESDDGDEYRLLWTRSKD